MTEHLRLLAKRLTHLKQMRKYLEYSAQRVHRILPITSWQDLSFEQHETLAAFRVRFSEFQEHLGKTMRAIAIEEEVEAERFGAILAFMEKLGIIETTERWKLIRELRNAINHEYEEDAERLAQFFLETLQATPELFDYFQRLLTFCADTYGVKPE
jgi:hypothetical protein